MKDERAQMMLLAGVLLVIGFIALAGLVSVAQRLGESTLQDEGRSVLQEIAAVSLIVNETVERTLADYAIGTTDFGTSLNESMRHLEVIENRRGFVFDFTFDNFCGGTWRVSVADAGTRASLTGGASPFC